MLISYHVKHMSHRSAGRVLIRRVCHLAAGETVEERRKKMQTTLIARPSTNVIVQLPKVSLGPS